MGRNTPKEPLGRHAQVGPRDGADGAFTYTLHADMVVVEVASETKWLAQKSTDESSFSVATCEHCGNANLDNEKITHSCFGLKQEARKRVDQAGMPATLSDVDEGLSSGSGKLGVQKRRVSFAFEVAEVRSKIGKPFTSKDYEEVGLQLFDHSRSLRLCQRHFCSPCPSMLRLAEGEFSQEV